jgi:hypothetical protein
MVADGSAELPSLVDRPCELEKIRSCTDAIRTGQVAEHVSADKKSKQTRVASRLDDASTVFGPKATTSRRSSNKYRSPLM